MKTRVVRVGGSLLTWDHFVPTLRTWLEVQSDARHILIAGGGPWVELLRQAAIRFQLNDKTAHWMCVRAMRTTADLLASLCETRVVTTLDELTAIQSTVVFDVDLFLQRQQHGVAPLPESWDVTSDSIAARLAEVIEADEFVLLKSSSPPCNPNDRQALARLGYVDPYFPCASEHLNRIRYVNLRAI